MFLFTHSLPSFADPPMNLYLTLLLLLLVTHFPKSFYAQNEKHDACLKPLQCGSLGNLSYPFYDGSTRPDYCGYPGFKIDCQGKTRITISDQDYYLLGVDNYNINVSRTDNWAGFCPHSLENSTIDFSKFNFTSSDQNITFFYACGWNTDLSKLSLATVCNFGGSASTSAYYLTQEMMEKYEEIKLFEICDTSLLLPILQAEAEEQDHEANLETLIQAFMAGFELGLMAEIVNPCRLCTGSGGECGYDWGNSKFACYCANGTYDVKCGVNSPMEQSDPKEKGHPETKIILVTAGIVMLGFLILFSYYILRKCKPVPRIRKCKPVPQNQSVEEFLKSYASLVPIRYTYASIKKMTNSFREKLGEGGYGAVFKGKLQDGLTVAVKVLKQSKCDGQEFVNEVVSTCRTNHINVIRLLGFCFEGHKRALIYEFMPNGSLEKFINGKDSKKMKQALSFEKLFEIAVGVARGLEYLHRGCNTRILHFDIKPHNILLDAKYTPKISDFGLAKLCNQEKSIISMSGARGTAGYIAPELVLRTFGGVSHKSDVYSYGMMVLDMVGCRKRVDESVESSGELYFPQWIYKQLEQVTEVDGGILNEDKELERKMILIGLWCIQTNPSSRPPMSRVVEMLEGKVELLEVPPVPSLSSPPRQQPMDDDTGALLSSATL